MQTRNTKLAPLVNPKQRLRKESGENTFIILELYHFLRTYDTWGNITYPYIVIEPIHVHETMR